MTLVYVAAILAAAHAAVAALEWTILRVYRWRDRHDARYPCRAPRDRARLCACNQPGDYCHCGGEPPTR